MNLVNGLLPLPSVSLYHYTVLFIIADPKQYVERVSHMNRSLVTVVVYS